jgi:hypothetical protein
MTNVDELIAIWRSQDAAPLHGVNNTMLQQALRQDQAKLHAQRRRQAGIMYLASAFVGVAMAFFCLVMIYRPDVMTGWDLVIPIVGAAAALVMAVALFASRREQALREGRFGDSLRDQLGRRIAQLDYEITRGSRLATVLLVAIFLTVTAMILVSAFSSVTGIWVQRRAVTRDVSRQKGRLEALLKELDAA